MVLDKPLVGRFVNLRSVTEDDAEFILQIRNDPKISKYLPPLNVTVEQQREWIRRQREDNESYYFVIERKEGQCLGTISVYNIESSGMAEVGRICSYGISGENQEAGNLLHLFCSKELHLVKTTLWVYGDNIKAKKYWTKQGYNFTSEGVTADGEKLLTGSREVNFE